MYKNHFKSVETLISSSCHDIVLWLDPQQVTQANDSLNGIKHAKVSKKTRYEILAKKSFLLGIPPCMHPFFLSLFSLS